MIHPKAKAWMNIPLCCMISMLVVRLALKIDVLKMDMCSKWAIERVTEFYMSLPQTSKVRRHLLQITSMNGIVIGKSVNATFKEVLNSNEDL